MVSSPPPSSSANPMPAQNNGTPHNAGELVFGRYQIIRRLAVGGMGEVFLARQSGVAGFDRLVILKSLLPDLASQQDFVDQFLDEARVAATLNHPNIVSIYEVGLWNGTYFIAMEYIKGDNLSRLQRAAERAKRAIPMDVAAYIVHDAAQALDHAHKATDLHGKALQIVHRDVSPQNIMVRTDGVTKVVDFGIAKAANRSSRTATGLLKGKVQYMAPEQVSGAELDGRADQFALGVVLWEMVAGRKLFSGASDLDVLKSVLQAPIPSLTQVAADVHPGLAASVDRMLERNRDRRYPSLSEAAQDLKKYLDVVGFKNVQEHAANFVAETLGDEINSKTVDLTPSGANNFVINLANSAPPTTGPTAHHIGFTTSKAPLGIAAGLIGALVLGVVAWLVLTPPAEESVAPAVVQRQAPKVAVQSQPAGAIVRIDGKEVGKAPQTFEVGADVEHAVEMVADGYEPKVEKVTLKDGEMRAVFAVLAKKPLTASITSEPSGAEVREGGVLLGRTPLQVTLSADEDHDLRLNAEARGKRLVGSTSLKGPPGSSVERKVTLEARTFAAGNTGPAVAPVAAGTGLLTVKTTPWAKISIDGKPYGTTPIAKVELSAGVHVIKLEALGSGAEITKKVTIVAGQSNKQNWTL